MHVKDLPPLLSASVVMENTTKHRAGNNSLTRNRIKSDDVQQRCLIQINYVLVSSPTCYIVNASPTGNIVSPKMFSRWK